MSIDAPAVPAFPPTEFSHAIALLMPEDAPVSLKEFATVWLRARAGRRLPTFAKIDPTAMIAALPYVFIVGRRDDGCLEYRLVGDEMDHRLGGNLRGKTAYDVFPTDYACLVEARWRQVLDDRDACYIRTRHVTLGERPLLAQRLMFPLVEDDDRVTRLVGIAHFERQRLDSEPLNGVGEELHVRYTPIADLPGASG